MERNGEGESRSFQKEKEATPVTENEDLKTLRLWINLQPHLPNLEDNSEIAAWLRNFLANCKNRMEKAKSCLDYYFSCRSFAPELFRDRDPSEPRIASNVKALYLCPLPKLTPEGYRIHLFSHAVAEPSAYVADDFMRRALMFLDWKIKEDVTRGEIFIFHMKHSSLAHLAKYNLATFSRFVAIATKAYPLSIKAVHFTMAPPFVGRIITNPFVTDKIKKRIKVHVGEDFASLLADIPAHCLPRELGGTLECTLEELNDAHHERLLGLRQWFVATEKLKSDESKRQPETSARNELFGYEGSFRNLTVD